MTDGQRDLHRVSRDHLERWQLRPDGSAREDAETVVTPVVTADGVAAVLKVDASGAGHEHLVLRRWAGAGAVRLLRADPPERTVLVERLHSQSLLDLPDIEACQIMAGLYNRLHVPPMPQLRSATADLERWSSVFEQLPRDAPIPRRLVEQASALSRDLSADSTADVVLHGDLHYGKVLRGDREPWLAIAPHPLNGDRHYELAPMLWHRWDELAGNVRDGVRRRFYAVVDAARLDEDRARAWTLIRVVHAWTRELVDAQSLGAPMSTRYAAIAKAVQD